MKKIEKMFIAILILLTLQIINEEIVSMAVLLIVIVLTAARLLKIEEGQKQKKPRVHRASTRGGERRAVKLIGTLLTSQCHFTMRSWRLQGGICERF